MFRDVKLERLEISFVAPEKFSVEPDLCKIIGSRKPQNGVLIRCRSYAAEIFFEPDRAAIVVDAGDLPVGGDEHRSLEFCGIVEIAQFFSGLFGIEDVPPYAV